MIQIGGAYAFCQEEGILVQKYRGRKGRCIAILFSSIGVRGRCDSPEVIRAETLKEIGKELNGTPVPVFQSRYTIALVYRLVVFLYRNVARYTPQGPP